MCFALFTVQNVIQIEKQIVFQAGKIGIIVALGEAVQILIRPFLQMKTEIIICADLLIIRPSSNRLPAGADGAVKCQASTKEKSNQHNTIQSSLFTFLCSSANRTLLLFLVLQSWQNVLQCVHEHRHLITSNNGLI